MATNSTHVIQYVGDISNIRRAVATIGSINKSIGDNIGKEFANVNRIVGQTSNSIKNLGQIKFGGVQGLGELKELGSIVQTADGQFKKFNQSVLFLDGQAVKTTSSLTDVTSQFKDTDVTLAKFQKTLDTTAKDQLRLVGASSQLGTNFASISDVSQKFSKQLQEFGGATRIVGSELTKVDDNTKKIVSTVETGNGQFVKLTETIKRTDQGLQTVGRSAQVITKPVQQLQGQASQLATNFANTQQVFRDFSGQLQGFGSVARIVGREGEVIGDGFKKSALVVETTNGQFLRLNQTVRQTPDGIQKVDRSVKDVTGTFRRTAIETEKAAKSQVTLTENLKRLAGRALLTIPVWFALRGAITAVFSTIRDGLSNLGKLERSLQKLRQNLLATSKSADEDLGNVRDQLLQLSLETGIAIEKLVNATQKFATVGFNTEESLAGAINSTKLAVTLFGDAEETADAFSRSLRVLVDRSDGAASAGQQIAEAMALTSQLWKQNQFDINEVNQGLEKFSAVAKTTNLSMKETLVLLATLGTAAVGGARGGTLLRTSFQKFVENLDQVALQLGVNINPKLDTTFGALVKVVDALEALDKNSLIAVERTGALAKIFGGIRGSLPIQALTALNKLLKENAALVPNLGQFNKEFKDLTKTLPLLQDQFVNLNREIGKAFVTGLIGGEEFEDTLQKIIKTQTEFRDSAERIGRVLRDALAVAGVASVIAFRKELLTTFSALGKFSKFAGVSGIVLAILDFNAQAVQLEKDGKKLINQANKIGQNIGDNIVKGLQGQLSTNQLQDLLKSLETFGAVQLGFDTESFDKTIDLLKQRLELTKKIEEAEKKVTDAEEQSARLAPIILKQQLEILKARGALQSEILRAENLTRRQLNIESQKEDFIQRQLDLEKAINEERRLQNNLSSDAVKLFQIARDEGSAVAKSIGDVLSGDTDFGTFVRRGGKELEIFKKEFQDIFEAQQAESFFKGLSIPGLEGLRGGAGISLPLSDQAVAGRTTAGQALRQAQQQARRANRLFESQQFTAQDATVKELRAGKLSIQSFASTPNLTNAITNRDISNLPNTAITDIEAMKRLLVSHPGFSVTGPDASRVLSAIASEQQKNNPFLGINPQDVGRVNQQIIAAGGERTVTLQIRIGDELRQISGLPEKLLGQVEDVVRGVSQATATQVVNNSFDNLALNPEDKNTKKLIERLTKF